MTSLIEAIQKNLGYQPIQKMDPNTQDVKLNQKDAGVHSLAQAAIPSVACGLLNKLQSKEGADLILHQENANWLDLIFGKHVKEFVARIADYAGSSVDSVKQDASHIANEAARLIREAMANTMNPEAIHSYAAQQKNETLLYLPASLHLGDLVNNNPLDDSTHKMEGPISSLMHSIENKFN